MDFISRRRALEVLDWAMENPLLCAGIASAAGAVVVGIQTIRAWLRLRHIPGPPLAGFTNLWLVRVIMGGNAHWELGLANEKYGKFYEIMTGLPLAFEVSFGTHVALLTLLICDHT